MLTNLACSISRLRGNGVTLRYRDYTIDRLGVMAQQAEKMLLKMMNDCAMGNFFSKSLNPRNIDKSVSDIRFPFESSFLISVSGCKLTILPDMQPENHMVIISGLLVKRMFYILYKFSRFRKMLLEILTDMESV